MAGAAVYKQRKNEESDLSRFSRGANLTAWSLKKTRERETQESQEPKNLKETAKDKVQMHAVSIDIQMREAFKKQRATVQNQRGLDPHGLLVWSLAR